MKIVVVNADWDESKHPRDDEGKFSNDPSAVGTRGRKSRAATRADIQRQIDALAPPGTGSRNAMKMAGFMARPEMFPRGGWDDHTVRAKLERWASRVTDSVTLSELSKIDKELGAYVQQLKGLRPANRRDSDLAGSVRISPSSFKAIDRMRSFLRTQITPLRQNRLSGDFEGIALEQLDDDAPITFRR